MKEKYQPSQEEINKAKEIMKPSEREVTRAREIMLNSLERGGKDGYVEKLRLASTIYRDEKDPSKVIGEQGRVLRGIINGHTFEITQTTTQTTTQEEEGDKETFYEGKIDDRDILPKDCEKIWEKYAQIAVDSNREATAGEQARREREEEVDKIALKEIL